MCVCVCVCVCVYVCVCVRVCVCVCVCVHTHGSAIYLLPICRIQLVWRSLTCLSSTIFSSTSKWMTKVTPPPLGYSSHNGKPSHPAILPLPLTLPSPFLRTMYVFPRSTDEAAALKDPTNTIRTMNPEMRSALDALYKEYQEPVSWAPRVGRH